MKSSRGLFLVVGTLLALSFMSCVSGPSAAEYQTVGPNDSVVLFQRGNSFVGIVRKLDVYIDGQKVATVGNNATARIVIPNGEHTLNGGQLSNELGSSLPFIANSEEITVFYNYLTGDAVITAKRPL